MKAEFAGITQFIHPSRLVPPTPEEAICYMARVSNPSNQDAKLYDTDKLISFLVRQGHWSPFDMIDMVLKIETSRAIMAQILRHWSFRFQEFSMRYSAVETPNYNHVEIREKAAGGNRQGSAEINHSFTNEAIENCDLQAAEYQRMIDQGAAPESARMMLPLATLTTAYMHGSVRSWMTYFWQRLDSHAQKEHRELAELMFAIFSEHFPNIAKLVKAGRPQYVLFDQP